MNTFNTRLEKYNWLKEETDTLEQFFAERARDKCEADEMFCGGNKHVVSHGNLDEVNVHKDYISVCFIKYYSGDSDSVVVELTFDEINCTDEEFNTMMENLKVKSKAEKEAETVRRNEASKEAALKEIERIKKFHGID